MRVSPKAFKLDRERPANGASVSVTAVILLRAARWAAQARAAAAVPIHHHFHFFFGHPSQFFFGQAVQRRNCKFAGVVRCN
jgi:hypothetical protein